MAKPEKISDALAGALEKAGLGKIIAMRGLHEKWPRLVGEGMARHSMPVMLKSGTLTLVVDNPAWMNEISLLSPGIIEKVNASLGQGTVTDIRLRQGKVEQAEVAKGGGPATKSAGGEKPGLKKRPLTAEQAEEIDRAVSAIEDEGIRKSARRMIEAAYATVKRGK